MYDVQIYGPPNPALSQILKSPQLEAVVWNYAVKVATVYRQNLSGRKGAGRNGLHLADTVNPETIANGGYSSDRWIGQVTVGNARLPYGASDEFGRHNPSSGQHGSTYQGSHALRDALHSVLPYAP